MYLMCKGSQILCLTSLSLHIFMCTWMLCAAITHIFWREVLYQPVSARQSLLLNASSWSRSSCRETGLNSADGVNSKTLTLLLPNLNKNNLLLTVMSCYGVIKIWFEVLPGGIWGRSECCHNELDDRQSHDNAADVRVRSCTLTNGRGHMSGYREYWEDKRKGRKRSYSGTMLLPENNNNLYYNLWQYWFFYNH